MVSLESCPDHSFDAVIDGHCLHCIIGQDRQRCLAAVARVLKPDGIFVVLTMCGDVLSERTRSFFDPRTRTIVVNGRPTRYIGTAQDILSEMEAAGFVIETARIAPRRERDEQDDLIVTARKPRDPVQSPST